MCCRLLLAGDGQLSSISPLASEVRMEVMSPRTSVDLGMSVLTCPVASVGLYLVHKPSGVGLKGGVMSPCMSVDLRMFMLACPIASAGALQTHCAILSRCTHMPSAGHAGPSPRLFYPHLV